MDPEYSETLRLATTCSSLQHEEIRCSSWLTTMTPPWKPSMAFTSASMVSMSKWLVGSSMISRCGFLYMAMARLTRNFCPPESVLMSWFGSTSPESPKCPRCWRIRSSCEFEPSPGKRSSASCSGRESPSSDSRWCCAMYSMRAPRWRLHEPVLGLSLPSSSLMSVLLPAPFLPRIAMRLLWSTEKLTPEKSAGASP
mmetsp:Transcript_46634/g.148918  ORF Transcript_46634/g.148918 Transcript_46634/m.148918 type:complete len:197 (+) Transcript_46634:113-703(+)